MSLRRIPGTSQQYFLVTYDKRGEEVPDADGTSASKEAIAALADPAAAVTDVFILSHGWQGDYDDAVRQYDRWIGAANPDTSRDGIRPFLIGLHWPSKAWSDRELKSESSGLLGDEPADSPDAVTIEEAVAEYAASLGDSPEVREALTTVLAYAAEIDPDQDASDDDELPSDVAEAYRVLAAATAPVDAEEPLLGSGWDPDDAFGEAVQAQGDDGGLLGDGWFQKLRQAVLTPLRQLTFWHGKNQAREFGERGAAKLLREVMAASPARVHLMGHSFGTIVVSSAVRGPGKTPVPPPRPVSSLFLVQGAVSLWAFSADVPDSIGGGRGYLADVVTPEFVSGPIVVTRSKWDYAVGKYYPLAVRVAGQFLLGDEFPKYGGIGTFGIQGVEQTVELPALKPHSRSRDHFVGGKVYNIDASAVIAKLDGASGAHNDLAHSELSYLGWTAALSQAKAGG